MNRRKAREIVLCLTFEREYHKDIEYKKLYETADIQGIYKSLEDNKDIELTESEIDYEYIKSVFYNIFENIEKIDNLIADASIGWSVNRISKVSMAIMRVSVGEILYMDDIPLNVSINEAVELAKKYDSEDAYVFINGVLGSVAKSV